MSVNNKVLGFCKSYCEVGQFRRWETPLFTVGLTFLLCNTIHAKDWKEDMKKLNNTYVSSQSFEMNVNVNMFEHGGDAKPMMSYSGKVAKTKNCYYSSMSGRTTVVNPTCSVLIDERQKMILYTTRPPKEKDKVKADVYQSMNLDSAVMSKAEVHYLTGGTDEICLEVKGKGLSSQRMDIYIDSRNYTLKRIVLFYSDEEAKKSKMSKVVIEYSQTKLNNPIAASLFSENKYIVKKGSEIKPSDAFKKYQLVDESKPAQP
jgi:hypothetical protein